MKRLAALILVLIYFVTSTGATMQYHYCMGQIVGSSLMGDKEKNCGKCGMDKNASEDNGCCKDEMQWIKIADDQKTNNFQTEIPSLLPIETILFNSGIRSVYDLIESRDLAYSKAPLRYYQNPTYILNCVFRI